MFALARGSVDALKWPCRDIFLRGVDATTVIGPLLEDEAAAVLREHYK